MIILRNNNIREIEYNNKNILLYKNPSNMLRHARYIPGKTNGIMLINNKTLDLVGYIAWEGDTIIALEVTPSYRKQGIATQLIKKSGASRLTVRKNNEGAIKLYKDLGWIIEKDLGKVYLMKKQ